MLGKQETNLPVTHSTYRDKHMQTERESSLEPREPLELPDGVPLYQKLLDLFTRSPSSDMLTLAFIWTILILSLSPSLWGREPKAEGYEHLSPPGRLLGLRPLGLDLQRLLRRDKYSNPGRW